MDSPLNVEQECCLCQDVCSSLDDLRSHLRNGHNKNKQEAALFVQLSVEAKVGKKVEEGVEEEDLLQETDDEEISEEFKAFLEAEVKSSVDSLFKGLFDVLDGKTVPDIPEGDFEEEYSIVDIRDAFEDLQDEIQRMEIPDSVMDSLKEAFESQQTTNEQVSKEETNVEEEEPKRKRSEESGFKVPENRGEATTELAPLASDHSSRSFLFPLASQIPLFFTFKRAFHV